MTSTFTPSPADERSELNTPTAAEALHEAAPAPGEVTLPGQLVRVYFDDRDPFDVRTQNRDRIAWEKTAPRHKWGSAQESPNRFITFIAWNAAKRDGQTDLTHAQWEDQLVDYDLLSEAPTRPTR